MTSRAVIPLDIMPETLLNNHPWITPDTDIQNAYRTMSNNKVLNSDLSSSFHSMKKIPTESVFEIMTELMNEGSVMARNTPTHSCPFLSMLASFQSQNSVPVKVTVCPTGNLSDFLVTSCKTEKHNQQGSPDIFTSEKLTQSFGPTHSSKTEENIKGLETFDPVEGSLFNSSSHMRDPLIKLEAAEVMEVRPIDHTEKPSHLVYTNHSVASDSNSQPSVKRKRGRPRKHMNTTPEVIHNIPKYSCNLTASHDSVDIDHGLPNSQSGVKRKRGRPKKHVNIVSVKIPKYSKKINDIQNEDIEMQGTCTRDSVTFAEGLPNSKYFVSFPALNGRELRCAVYGCNKTWSGEGTMESVRMQWLERDKHVGLEHGDVSRECCKCQASFKTVHLFFKHLDTLHPNDEDKPYVCCEERFHTQWHISSHISTNHPNSIEMKTREIPERAENDGTGDSKKDTPVYECTQCPATFVYKQHLTRHMSHHMEPQFLCQFCSKAFRGERMLETHIANSHPSGTTFPCMECSREFGSAKLLNYHVASQHTTRQCVFCDQVFDDYRLLREHKFEKHIDMQTTQCEHCYMKFFSNDELKIHNASCHKEKPCPSCREVFRNKKELDKHRRAHHKRTETHSCDKCKYECSTSYKMRRHMFTRHGIGTGVKCSLCSKEFAEKCSLQVNIVACRGGGVSLSPFGRVD